MGTKVSGGTTCGPISSSPSWISRFPEPLLWTTFQQLDWPVSWRQCFAPLTPDNGRWFAMRAGDARLPEFPARWTGACILYVATDNFWRTSPTECSTVPDSVPMFRHFLYALGDDLKLPEGAFNAGSSCVAALRLPPWANQLALHSLERRARTKIAEPLVEQTLRKGLLRTQWPVVSKV
eukprot:5579077-Pyramimonas_sp.AAC.1